MRGLSFVVDEGVMAEDEKGAVTVNVVEEEEIDGVA